MTKGFFDGGFFFASPGVSLPTPGETEHVP
jgi:hypothetical protein